MTASSARLTTGTVGEAMTPGTLMREHSTSHLIVVADESSPLPIGVLSTLDIARVFATETAPASRSE